MRRDYSTEQFESFLQELKESFWGDLQGQVEQTVKAMLEVDSEQRMEEYLGLRWYERPVEQEERVDSRNGYYEPDYATPWGIIRFRVRRTRFRFFLPPVLGAFERRAPEVAELIRQAFLRGVPTRAVAWWPW
jgi:transposase-like protein